MDNRRFAIPAEKYSGVVPPFIPFVTSAGTSPGDAVGEGDTRANNPAESRRRLGIIAYLCARMEQIERVGYDVIVVGAGAAGMMAAGTAARNGLRVLLLEKMEKSGRKVSITCKGRCNETKARTAKEIAEHVRANAEFFAPAFAEFNNRATIRFFERMGVRLDTERGERVFPQSGKAWDIANALLEYCVENGVKICYDTQVTEIMTLGQRVFGVKYINRRGFERKEECARLLLRNVGARLFVDNEPVREEFGEVGFSERGIEGAVALRVSRDAVDALIDGRSVKLVLDLKPALDEQILRDRIAREREALGPEEFFSELLRKLVPKPLVMPLAYELDVNSRVYMRKVANAQIERLIKVLKGMVFPITDYAPFEYAVVTAGGVDCAEVNPLTMESRRVRGLYFAGEVLDLDADTGGYNLQIAFSTGRLAGMLKQ